MRVYTCYRSYANIIDLTLPDSDEESTSEELPPIAFDLCRDVTARFVGPGSKKIVLNLFTMW